MGNLHGRHRPAGWGLTFAAARTTATLGVLFFVVYGGTNWITAQRPEADVGTWYFSWELALPFVPLMILPYMSIDLFFAAAPFLCSDRRELTVLARRITFAILVAGTFFLLVPLRLVYPREPVAGWLGVIFNTFREMDQPHNLFPSLHITLRTILAVTYARHTRGVAFIACQIWFSLIGFSTVLTYQHHLVDIAGGMVLAAVALYLFREADHRLPVTPNPRIAAYYGAATVALVALALLLRPWGLFLLCPATGLGMVTGAYLGVGPGVYRKTDGRLPLSVRFVLAPILIGQWLSLLYYSRQCRAWDAIAPGVWIGRVLTNAEAAAVRRQGVTAVLDLTGEFPEAPALRNANYRNIPILDLTAPTAAQLHAAVTFITEEAAKGMVYVHCKIGYSRSAAVVGAYLLASGQAGSPEDAVAVVRRARPSIVVRAEVMGALRAFAETSALTV